MESQQNVAPAETDNEQLQSREGLGAALPRPRVRSEKLESLALVKIAGLAALERKAEDLRLLEVAKKCDFTDYFLICSGTNERQVQAIADAIEEAMFREGGMKPLHIEGRQQARWVLLDFGGDMVAHVFVDSARRFYELERLWSDAPDITERLLAGAAATAAATAGAADKTA